MKKQLQYEMFLNDRIGCLSLSYVTLPLEGKCWLFFGSPNLMLTVFDNIPAV